MVRFTLGPIGEQKAAEYLKSKGFEIRARNYRIRGGEIDIVAEKSRRIYFIEVKSRASASFGAPFESIHSKKIAALIKSGYLYLKQNNLTNHEFQFDAIEVIHNRGEFEIHYLPNITL